MALIENEKIIPKLIVSFMHSHTRFFSRKSCRGSSPKKTRNTSWFSAIFYSFAALLASHQDNT